MGWTGIVGRTAKTSQEKQDFIKSEVLGKGFEAMEIAVRGSEVYVAAKHIKSNSVFGMVVLLRYETSGGLTELMYKDMDESEGPFYYNAPKKLIKLLNAYSEPVNDSSAKWRRKCMEKSSSSSASKSGRYVIVGKHPSLSRKFALSIGDYNEIRRARKIALGTSFESKAAAQRKIEEIESQSGTLNLFESIEVRKV